MLSILSNIKTVTRILSGAVSLDTDRVQVRKYKQNKFCSDLFQKLKLASKILSTCNQFHSCALHHTAVLTAAVIPTISTLPLDL